MSTRQLFVLRHAKSSWDDPGLDDFERPLAPRGQRAVELLADYVRTHEIRPEQVLCSPARRTRATLEGVAPPGEYVIEPDFYSASAGAILERLHHVPDGVSAVMVVGHNPAMQLLVLRLAAAEGPVSDGSPLADVRRKFPTGALATMTFDCGWSELRPGCARLTGYTRPKALRFS